MLTNFPYITALVKTHNFLILISLLDDVEEITL